MDFNQKKQIIRNLDNYIDNRFLNIFSNHHHNERAINTRKYIEAAENTTTIKWIINNEISLLETGKYLSGYDLEKRTNEYSSSKFSQKISSANYQTSSYYKTISNCKKIINGQDQDTLIKTAINTSSLENNNLYDRNIEANVASAIKQNGTDSFILDESIILESHTTYIYVIYYINATSDLEIRITKDDRSYSKGSRKHPTLAHVGKFNPNYFTNYGIEKNLKALMAGEIITGENSYEVEINNESGHFKPSQKSFEDCKKIIEDKLGPLYYISYSLNLDSDFTVNSHQWIFI